MPRTREDGDDESFSSVESDDEDYEDDESYEYESEEDDDGSERTGPNVNRTWTEPEQSQRIWARDGDSEKAEYYPASLFPNRRCSSDWAWIKWDGRRGEVQIPKSHIRYELPSRRRREGIRGREQDADINRKHLIAKVKQEEERDHRQRRPAAVKLEGATDDESATCHAVKREDAVDLVAVKREDTVDLADFTSSEGEKGDSSNDDAPGSEVNPAAIPAAPPQEKTTKKRENSNILSKEEIQDLIRPHVPILGTGSNGAPFAHIAKKVRESVPDLILRRKPFENSFRKELEIKEIDGARRYFLRPLPPRNGRTVPGELQTSTCRPDFCSSEGKGGNLLNDNKPGNRANTAAVPATPPREEETKKKKRWSTDEIKELIRPHISTLGPGSKGPCVSYTVQEGNLLNDNKPGNKANPAAVPTTPPREEETKKKKRWSTNEIKDLIKTHISTLGPGSKGPCFSYTVQKVKESVPQSKLRVRRFRERFGEELKVEGFGSSKRYCLRPSPPRDGGTVRSELQPSTRPPSRMTLDSGIERTKPKRGRGVEKKYLSRFESNAEVEDFLLSLLPSLQRKDVEEYCESFAGDGFDSRDMLECVEEEDLHFMKKAHRRELWKRLKKRAGAGSGAPKKSKKKKRRRETESSESNQTEKPGSEDDASVGAPKKSKKKKRKRETESSESNQINSRSEGGFSGVEADKCKKKKKKKHKKRKKE